MKVAWRWMLSGVIACTALTALVVSRQQAATTSVAHVPASPSYPRLLVAPGWTQGGMFMDVHGALSVNAQGCITVGGEVIVTRDGSRVTPDGKHVIFAGWAPIRLHSYVGGGGGWYPNDWLDGQTGGSVGDELVAQARHCLADDPDAGLLQFWLAE